METDIFDAIRDASNHLVNEPTEDGLEHRADVAAIEKMLRANAALVHAREEFTESTPLHMAAQAYLPRVAELLLKFGADVNAVAQGMPVLSTAVSNDSGDEFDGQVKVVEVLIRHGADLNAQPPDNFTPLYTAVSTCKDRIAGLLLKAGADLNRLNRARETPLYRALWADNWEHAGAAKVVRLLVQHGAVIDLRSAIIWAKKNRVQELLKSGQVSPTELQDALLDACCRVGWLEGAGLLLNAGADVNAPAQGNRLALNEALGYMSEVAVGPIVEFLLQRGANPNLKDYLNQTAVEVAQKHLKHGVHRERKIVNLLKEHEAKTPAK